MALGAEVDGRATRIALAMLPMTAALAASSLLVFDQAHAEDARVTFPREFQVSPKGVNLQTGLFTYTHTDLAIGPLKLDRIWGDQPDYTAVGHSIGLISKKPSHWGGWTHTFNIGVFPTSSGPTTYYTIFAGGQKYTFRPTSDGKSIIPADYATNGANLASLNGQWEMTDKAGAIYDFFPHTALPQGPTYQVISRITYPNGSTLDFSYNANAQPHFIRSSLGYAIVIDYDANKNASAVCGFNLAKQYVDATSTCSGAQLRATYSYSSDGNSLTGVRDVLNHLVTISYSPTAGPAPDCISLPDSAVCEIQNTYGDDPNIPLDLTMADQVRLQKTPTGDVWHYVYVPEANTTDDPPQPGQPRYSETDVMDPLGNTGVALYDRGRLTEYYGTGSSGPPAIDTKYLYAEKTVYPPVVFGAPGPWVVDYHAPQPALVINAEGDRRYVERDARGNVTFSSTWSKTDTGPMTSTGHNFVTDPQCCVDVERPPLPADAINIQQTFYGDYDPAGSFIGCGAGPADAKRCDRPIAKIDSKNQETDYDYYQEHGGIKTETGPADANGVRPQTRYFYVQRYARVLNASGSLVAAGAPVWLLDYKTSCRSSAANGNGCSAAGDEVRTSYEYGSDSQPNNLLLRGVVEDATGRALRTCYAYDTQGNKVSETKPRAGLAVCP